MKKYIGYIANFLKSRLFWNIFFWVFLLGFWRYEEIIEKPDYPVQCYYLFRVVFWALMMALSYFNNLFLVPRLLAKRKFLVYTISVLVFVYAMSFLVVSNFAIMQHYFPKMKVWQISFINTQEHPAISVGSLLDWAFEYFFFLLTWVCVFTMAWYVRDYSRQANVLEDSRKKQVESELSFLKSQINPHFLFNTLNNLYGLALKKSDNAPDAILKLSAILRYLLYESNVPEISFEKEKEIMQAYIDLELLRITQMDNLHFSVSADKDHKIPPLLWLPVLENVFKHGTRFISEEYSVDFRFNIQDNNLTMYSKNNYQKSAGKENGEETGGIGLTNLRKRLELLYPGKYIIDTKTEGNEYITEIMIKLA